MQDDKLNKLYTALTKSRAELGDKPFLSTDKIGANPEEFSKKLQDKEFTTKLHTALLKPRDVFGGSSFLSTEKVGKTPDEFVNIFVGEKKNPTPIVSTSGSKPSQGIEAGASVFINKAPKAAPIKTPKVSIGGDVKNAIISLEGAQMALVNKDKELSDVTTAKTYSGYTGGDLDKQIASNKDRVKKERDFIQKSVSDVVGRSKPLINKVVDEAITKDNLSGFTKNVDGKIIPDPLKIREYSDNIVSQTGLSEGKYVKDFIYNEVKANVQSKISQPKIEKKFEEIYKSKYGVSPEEAVNKDFASKFKDAESLKSQAKLKVREANSLAQTDFNIEMSKYSEEYKKKADSIKLNYTTQADNIKKTAEGLDAQYFAGQISREQYEANINQLNATLENSFDAYKDNSKLLADEFLKTQNATSSRYDRRLQRQYAEIDNSYQTELKNRLKNYQSKYVIPAELKKRYEDTYRDAAEAYNKEEGALDYQFNQSEGFFATQGKSLLSGLGQGIKELSYMADFDLGKKYGEFLETSFRLSEANLESMKDLLDPIKLARSSGQTIGAMAPMIAGNVGIAVLTQGASIPVQLAATGGFGFVMESMQMAGSMYDRKLAQTGIVADAEKAALNVIKANSMLMPLYAFDGLPLIGKATLGIKNRALRALAKGGIETFTEFTQEIPQSAFEDIIYKDKPLSDIVEKFDLTKSENRKEIFNTALNVIPTSILMGSAPTFLGYANKPINEIRGRAAFTKEQLEGLTDNALEQFFYDMQLTKGTTFTKAFLSGAYASGSVNEMQLIKLTDIVDKSTKVIEDAKALKLSNGESKVYAAYEFAADAYTKQAEQMEEGVAKDALLSKAAKAKKEAQEFLTNKKGDYVVLVMPNGEQYVYQSDFFISSTENYGTLRKLVMDGNATAHVVSSTKEGEKLKTKVTGLLKIADKKLQEDDSKPAVEPDAIQETEEKSVVENIDQELFDKISEEIGVLQLSLEQPSLSPESKQKIQARVTELEKQSEMVLRGEQVEYVSEGDNFFKILLDGTKEPISEQEFEQATEEVEVPEAVSALVEPVSAPVAEATAPAIEQVVEQPVAEEQVQEIEQEPQTQEQDATQESSQQVIQGGEQGDQLQRERTDEGQQKTGERKGSTRKAEKPKADSGNRPVSGRKKAEEKVAEQPKTEAPKPVGLTANETKYKENPDALSKDELKDVLDSKRERLKKANAALEKGGLTPEETKVKQKAIDNLDKTIEDLVKRIDAGVSKKIATKEDAIGSEEIPVKNQTRIKKSLDGLKNEFSSDKLKMKVIEAVEKGISVLQSAFPSMNIVIHKSSSDFLEATGLPMVNGKVPAGVFMFSGDTKVGYEGTIHINLTNANPTVVYHEIAHALMLKVLGENKAMFDSFKNKVSKILSEKTAANLNEFIAPYSESEKSEEYIVQLVAALTATKSNTNPSVLMKLKVAINELISKITGGKITVFAEEAEGIEVYNFLKQMAETIKEGNDISTLQESFNGDLFEPTELDITGITPDDIPASKRYPRAKEFRGDYEMVDHPIITNKILKGKPIAVTMSDHTKVGVYKNNKSGVEYSGLMGGVFYPYIKGIRDAGLGWASVTTKAARSLVANAINTDYTVVYRMSRATGSLGNVNFGDIAFLELTAPVTNKKVSEKIFLSELNSQLSKVKSGVSFLEKYGVNGKVNSITSLKKGLDKMSFSTRGEFWKVVMKGSWNKKSTGAWYQFLEKYNVASLEDIVNGLAEIEVDTALDHDVVAVLKIAKPEYTSDGIIKIYTTRKELVNEKKGVFFIDAPNHPSYPYVVKGEPIGVLNEFNNISEYFPVIKTWIESKRLNSPYKAVETMGKELISSRISELESQLKTTKEFIKKYKDDLFSKNLGIAKTPEQMVQSIREDEKFFRAIVDFAYLSIKLKGLKTIEAFKAELEKQLGVKFDKLPQELKDAWAQAKVMVSTEKKQAPTIKQTIKEGTEQGTSKEKIATFSEYMAAKYKGMAEGEKIGQKNRFEIIKEAAKYVKQAVSSDISRAKINSLINKAINIQNFDSVKSFAKYVDKLIENQEYYAKVAELEGLSAKVGKALRSDKFGSIVPQITRLLSINPENLTENGIDKYISLAKELLSNKVADVTNLESTLAQLKAEERTFIEGKLASDLMSDKELVDLLDKIDQLSKEKQSDILDAAEKKAIAQKRKVALDELSAKLNKKRSEIMEYASGDKVITNAKDYASLISAIKKYNSNINQMAASEFISEDKAEIMLIDLNSKELSLLEEALEEKLSDFRKSLTDQVKNIINSIKNQYNTGGVRARLFENLSDFDKKIYDPIIKDVLTIPLQTLPDLDIADLNTLFNAVEQLNNGYISPKLLESIEIIEAKAYQNTIAENADKLYGKQVDADGVYKEKLSPFASSVGSFSSWSELADFMKTFNYQDIKTAFTDGYAQIFGEYILTPVQKSLVRYKILLEDTISPIIKADDNLETFFNVRNIKTMLGKPSTADLTRNVLGIFFIQADHFRHEDFDTWTNNQKNLAKYLIDEYNDKNLNVSKDRMKLLKAAYSEIEGDISTKEGLKSAMDKYFSKNKKAKDLFYAIRNSIDNEVAPMNKVSIERDGGYFEQDQDYFQWQRAGEDIKGMESTFQDAIAERYDKDFKRKANATYKRKGSPFFMREFNATRAYYKMAEEAAINYEVEPVIMPFQKAVRELANKYKLAGKKDLAMFLQASNEYVFFSAKLMFEKYQSTFFNKAYSDAAAFVRRYRLGNIIRTSPDLLGTEAKLLLSMNPAEYAKYLTKQAREFNEDSFVQLAKLVSSPIEFKTTRANVENMQFNKPNAERRIDALTGLADRIAQTNAWKAFMMANFKKIKTELYNKKKAQINELLAEIKITNDDYKKNQLKETLATYKEELLKLSDTELDVKKMQANPIGYYAENKYVLDKAAFLSDQQIDTYTVNQFDLGRAPMVKVLPALTLSMLPFVSKEKAIKMLTVKRNSKSTIYLNFMGSYTGTEANLMSSAFQKILVQKNYVEGFRDIGSIMTSQFVYMSAMAAANAIASVIGFAVTNVFDGDDEDEYEKILEFAKKEWEEFSELYQDPIKLMQTYALTLALTPLAKYPTLSRSAVGFAVGLWSGAEIGSAQNKAEIKEAKSKWVDRYKVIQDKLYVNPIPFGVKDPKLTPTWGEYANMLDPISGFYLKLADDQLNPKKQGNLVELVREINKDGEASNNKMLIAGANLFMLGSIGYGSLFAPTYIKIMNENAKSQVREDIEKKKSKGTGKRNDGFGGFGSDGFSSSKF